MPPRNYMVVDPRHDHSLRVPRPDLSLKLGTPNACNGCHQDRSVRWAADMVAKWYGLERRAEPHYGEALDAGRAGRASADTALTELLEDPEAPGIVRATAASLLGPALSPASLPALERALRDDDELVRRAALSGLEALEPGARLERAAGLLEDPVRVVRIEAARLLAQTPRNRMTPAQREALAAALAEFRQVQAFNGDRPEAHANLGTLEASLGNYDLAERSFREAISIDPGFIPAYVNLADLYRVRERDGDGERMLREALVVSPDAAALHHALGLLLVRRQQRAEALEKLKRAAELAPGEPRYAYVYGVALHSAGDTAGALAVLSEAHQRSPADRETLWALATINRDRGARTEALRYARKLSALSPGHPGVQELVKQLQEGMR